MKFCSGLPQTSFVFISNSNSIGSLADSAPRYPELMSFHFWSRFYWKCIWFCSGPPPTNFTSFLNFIEMNSILLWTASNQFPLISNWNWVKSIDMSCFRHFVSFLIEIEKLSDYALECSTQISFRFWSKLHWQLIKLLSGLPETNFLSFPINSRLQIIAILLCSPQTNFNFISISDSIGCTPDSARDCPDRISFHSNQSSVENE